MPYMLRPELSCCCIGDRTILLDRARSRFFAVSPAHEALFRQWLSDPAGSLQPDAARQLLAAGLLILSSEPRLPAGPLVAAERYLSCADTAMRPAAVTQALWLRLIWSHRARHWPLGRLLAALDAIVAAKPVSEGDAGDRTVRQLVAAASVADLVFGRHNRCLARSLALAAACRQRGVASTLVIGVQANPFAAHCWLQRGPILLNETPDMARQFVPIHAHP